MQAIETRYKGYRFRSRLEARWAVFFDALGVKWEYEPEGYDLTDEVREVLDGWANEERIKKVVVVPPTPTVAGEYNWAPNGYTYTDYANGDHDKWTNHDQYSQEQITYLQEVMRAKGKALYLPDFYLPEPKLKLDIKPYYWEDFQGEPEHVLIKMSGTYIVHGVPGTIAYQSYGITTWDDSSHFFGYCPCCKKFDEGFCAWRERICGPNYKCAGWYKEDLSRTYPMLLAIDAARSARFEHGESG